MESGSADPVEDCLEPDPDDNLPLAQLVRRKKRQHWLVRRGGNPSVSVGVAPRQGKFG